MVKKYANRRLYNTESSSYITLDSLAQMVREGRDFIVYDAKSGEDITRGVLTQIIVEEESKGSALLPTAFLRHLIGFYGDSMQGVVPRYLEQSMANFTHAAAAGPPGHAADGGDPFSLRYRADWPAEHGDDGAGDEPVQPVLSRDRSAGQAGDGGDMGPHGPDLAHEVAVLRGELARLQKELRETRAQLTEAAPKPGLDSLSAAD